jgi:hypothetical protein
VARRFSIEVPAAAIARPKNGRKVPNHKSVTAARLETLGATRLAELLAEFSQEHPPLKRRLAYELAGAAGADGIAADIRHRLTALARAKTFIDWQGCRAFAKDLDLLRQMILEKVAAERPALALELLWQFMALAGSTFERVDDSNGRVSAVFRTACADLGTVAVKGPLDPIPLADQVFAAVTTNLYGEYDPLVEAVFPALGARGSQHLKRRLTAALKHPAGKDPDGSGAQGLKSALQDLADQEGDVDAFLGQESESARKIPHVAAQIGNGCWPPAEPQRRGRFCGKPSPGRTLLPGRIWRRIWCVEQRNRVAIGPTSGWTCYSRPIASQRHSVFAGGGSNDRCMRPACEPICKHSPTENVARPNRRRCSLF